jgi:transposase-like protein
VLAECPRRSGFAGFRFPSDVIMIVVRWYLRYGLSYRDVEELLAERNIVVDHVSRRCCIERVGAEQVIPFADLRHRWSMIVRHDH